MANWRTILRTTRHRPYPLPDRPWIGVMRWEWLLFMHWPVDRRVVSAMLPAGMSLDTFDGRAWIGVVPFLMTNTRPRGVPPVPGVSRFLELNVRTYVTVNGRPGVWFFSLDAASKLAVRGARRLFRLPYFDARMNLRHKADGWLHYTSTRTHRGAAPAELEMAYRPTGISRPSSANTLEHFLTDRFCLYSADRAGTIYRGEIHHLPWPLQPAEASITQNTMTTAAGIALPDTPPLLHYSHAMDVMVWKLVRA